MCSFLLPFSFWAVFTNISSVLLPSNILNILIEVRPPPKEQDSFGPELQACRPTDRPHLRQQELSSTPDRGKRHELQQHEEVTTRRSSSWRCDKKQMRSKLHWTPLGKGKKANKSNWERICLHPVVRTSGSVPTTRRSASATVRRSSLTGAEANFFKFTELVHCCPLKVHPSLMVTSSPRPTGYKNLFRSIFRPTRNRRWDEKQPNPISRPRP